MPTYDYECRKCGNQFNIVMSLSELEMKKKVRCPKCASADVQKLVEPFFALTSRKS